MIAQPRCRTHARASSRCSSPLCSRSARRPAVRAEEALRGRAPRTRVGVPPSEPTRQRPIVDQPRAPLTSRGARCGERSNSGPSPTPPGAVCAADGLRWRCATSFAAVARGADNDNGRDVRIQQIRLAPRGQRMPRRRSVSEAGCFEAAVATYHGRIAHLGGSSNSSPRERSPLLRSPSGGSMRPHGPPRRTRANSRVAQKLTGESPMLVGCLLLSRRPPALPSATGRGEPRAPSSRCLAASEPLISWAPRQTPDRLARRGGRRRVDTFTPPTCGP